MLSLKDKIVYWMYFLPGNSNIIRYSVLNLNNLIAADVTYWNEYISTCIYSWTTIEENYYLKSNSCEESIKFVTDSLTNSGFKFITNKQLILK